MKAMVMLKVSALLKIMRLVLFLYFVFCSNTSIAAVSEETPISQGATHGPVIYAFTSAFGAVSSDTETSELEADRRFAERLQAKKKRNVLIALGVIFIIIAFWGTTGRLHHRRPKF